MFVFFHGPATLLYSSCVFKRSIWMKNMFQAFMFIIFYFDKVEPGNTHKG